MAFGVSTVWQNAPGTRTEYSGEFSGGADDRYERIDWVTGTDIIRIYSPQVTTSESVHYADYGIQSLLGDGNKAMIAPVSGSGLQWEEADEYAFYALYPAPGTSWNMDPSMTVSGSAVSLVADPARGEGRAKVTGTVPSTQQVKWDGTSAYKPNMNYAFMYATALGSASSGIVTLSFHPLVTTLEFNLKAGDSALSGATLTGFRLKRNTTDKRLAGPFTAHLPAAPGVFPASGGDLEFGTDAEMSNLVTLSIDNGSETPTLSTGSSIKVTVFTLPVEQEALTVEMTFSKGGNTIVRTLDLKNRNNNSEEYTFLHVSPFCKAYINNLAVPGELWEFNFTVTEPPRPISYDHTVSTSYTVTSYKSKGGSTSPLKWTTSFSTDGGETWGDKPAWLTTFTSSGVGSATAAEYTAGSSSSPTADRVWEGSTVEVGTQSAPRDLSCYDIYGTKTGGTERSAPYNTANCYVVSAPGWYCFPLVYGNAIKNGATNTSAYRGTNKTNLMYGDAYTNSGVSHVGFHNHVARAIIDPWLFNNYNATEDSQIRVSRAQVFWQDNNGKDGKGLVSDVSLLDVNSDGKNDYVRFRVNIDPAKNSQGNAVIGVLPSSDVPFWSWHIWVMDNPEEKLSPKTVKNYAGTSYSMLSMNLGYCEGLKDSRSVLVKFTQLDSGKEEIITITQDGTLDFNNPSYQWGRKDPMLATVSGSSITDKTQWGNITNGTEDRTWIWARVFRYFTSTYLKPRVREAIQEPHHFFQTEGTINGQTKGLGAAWCRDRYDNLWNTAITTAAANGNYVNATPVTKTIYDPCPPGFHVPDAMAFTGFNTHGDNTNGIAYISASNNTDMSAYKGFYFFVDPSDHGKGTIYFPAFGNRAGSSGVGVSGAVYQTAAPFINSAGTRFGRVGMQLVWSDSEHRVNTLYTDDDSARGYLIRPVAD